MNEELASTVVQIWNGRAKFFKVNVLETESVTKAVKGVLAWVQETGKEVGGVIAAAGVSTPAKVIQISHFVWILPNVTSFSRSSIATLLPLTWIRLIL
jgi:hypothetical protein